MSTKHSIFLMSSVLVILVASTALLANPVSDNSREYTKPPAAPAANAIPAQLDEPDETAAPAEPAPAALPEDTGKYYISVETDTTDGDSIHIQDTWGPLSCEPEAEYRYEVGAEEMEFWTIEDPCPERNEVLDGTWERRD